MQIQSIRLHNFRNYEDLTISFDGGTTILYGDNAQGKTNILEAAYVSATSKSHKGAKDREMIRFGEDEAHIATTVLKENREYEIDLHLRKTKSKGIAVNKVPMKKASELFGILHIVMFSPEDMNMIKAGPSERRKFLDAELCQIDKIYLYNLKKYNKVLEQRNTLLKDIQEKPDLRDTLSLWDEKLLEYGVPIIKRRFDFLEELKETVSGTHYRISGEKENISIAYEPDSGADVFEEKLFTALDRDLYAGNTSVGPHRDDIKFTINNIDIRKFGSQGQQRTAALSLKLSEIKIAEDHIKDKPVLLLDDVLSELDEKRQTMLLNRISDTQTIVTCTGLDEFVKNRFHSDRVYEVKNGEVTLKE